MYNLYLKNDVHISKYHEFNTKYFDNIDVQNDFELTIAFSNQISMNIDCRFLRLFIYKDDNLNPRLPKGGGYHTP